jgi:Putative prokaryotic signal transducing protein
MTESRSTKGTELVKVAYANNEAEAEFLQGMLRNADVGSVLRRAPGFDVPDFLAAGPREVLVAAEDVPVARDVLREVDTGEVDAGEPEPEPPSRADRPSRVIVGVLLAAAIVAFVVCLATDVISLG